MSAIDDLLRANAAYAERFDRGSLPMPPARHLAIITCMDARIVPARAFGISEGDAHVIRNAGGRAQDALRSLVISQRLLGTREVAVIHHTDCGMLTFSNEELRARVRTELSADASDIDFLPFSDVEESVLEDVAYLRRSPLVARDVVIRGFVYDVRTGRLAEVTSRGSEEARPATERARPEPPPPPPPEARP
jgi:carbonic anhydrase